jgi:hypothetical protein
MDYQEPLSQNNMISECVGDHNAELVHQKMIHSISTSVARNTALEYRRISAYVEMMKLSIINGWPD